MKSCSPVSFHSRAHTTRSLAPAWATGRDLNRGRPVANAHADLTDFFRFFLLLFFSETDEKTFVLSQVSLFSSVFVNFTLNPVFNLHKNMFILQFKFLLLAHRSTSIDARYSGTQ